MTDIRVLTGNLQATGVALLGCIRGGCKNLTSLLVWSMISNSNKDYGRLRAFC